MLRVDKSFDWRWGLKKKELLDTLISVMMTGLELIYLDGNFEEAADIAIGRGEYKRVVFYFPKI